MNDLIQAIYFIASVLFIYGLMCMSAPGSARRGIVWAGLGMFAATLATFYTPGLKNFALMIAAMLIGSAVAYVSARRVAVINMPQMIALFNGMGGGAAAAIAAVELIKRTEHSLSALNLAVLGGFIGTVSFSGSLIAFAKLQGWIKRTLRFSLQQTLNLLVFAVTIAVGVYLGFSESSAGLISLFLLLAFTFGVLMTLPIGGADMPVVISLYNALTGLAVAFEGFVLNNAAMIIAGTVVGAAGTLLTQLMARAMNRPLANVLFGSFGARTHAASHTANGHLKPIDARDAGIMLAFANKLMIVPGYGMAVAQAQHKLWELARTLDERGVKVRFAIHPVAGRMPGHMNVLLAEAGVPYDKILDLDESNPEFDTADVALVIGANDVVNPMARTHPDSPIYGMPILNVDRARNVVVVKRGDGAGFSGVPNALFYGDKTRMLYGDGQTAVASLLQNVKEV